MSAKRPYSSSLQGAILGKFFSKKVQQFQRKLNPQKDSTKSEDDEGFGLYRTGTDSMTIKSYVVSIQLGNATVSMEVDSGASRSTVSQYVYNTLLTDFPLQNTDVTLPSYSGEKVPILGKVSVPVKYSSSDDKVLDLIVVQGKRPALFGRDWLSKIRLDWESIFKVT